MAAEETKRTMEEHRAWLDEHYKKAEQRLEKLKAEFRKEGYKIDWIMKAYIIIVKKAAKKQYGKFLDYLYQALAQTACSENR